MWLVRLALRLPYSSIVLAVVIILLGVVAILRTPKDVFPQIDEPVVTLIWQYPGIPADQFEKRAKTASGERSSQ